MFLSHLQGLPREDDRMSQIPNFLGLLEDPLHRAADASAVLSSAFEVTAYLTVMKQHS